ncbi:hypothetical protein SO802_001313 [Lithocarpus litseifolius]|uniref:Reverse transcriptase zinc-binding domain-containing protein n=1 Tax=Lithocarpus litseifolius TaxID=425828 RepID=A0AAW2DXT5_9ROSI
MTSLRITSTFHSRENGSGKFKLCPKSNSLSKCLHNSIGVKSCLAARGVNLDPLRPLCNNETETIIHILRDCRVVRPVWQNLGIATHDNVFFSGDVANPAGQKC